MFTDDCPLPVNTDPRPVLTDLPNTYTRFGTGVIVQLRVGKQTEYYPQPFLGISLNTLNIFTRTVTVLNAETGHILQLKRADSDAQWLLENDLIPPSLGGIDPRYLQNLKLLLSETDGFQQTGGQNPPEVHPELLEGVEFLKNLLGNEQAVVH